MSTPIPWTDETWNPVPGWPGFHASDTGLLIGPSGKILKPRVSASGHLYVQHRFGGRLGKMRKLYVHRAVLLVYAGECPEGQEARHLNGDPADNRIENLLWGTRSEQRGDDLRNGVQRGRSHIAAEVRMGITQLRGVVSSRTASRMWGVSHTTVLRIWGSLNG